MRYVETWIRFRHECPFCVFSERFPQAEMTLWVSALTDLFQINIPADYDVDEMLKVGKDLLDYTEAYSDPHSVLFLTQQPYLEEIDSFMARADEAECMLIPPMTFREGWETHHIVTRSQDNIRRLVELVNQMGEIEILSLKTLDHLDLMKDIGVVPGHLIDGLTDKQVYSLVTAYEAGLFDVPARVKMDQVANKIGLSRSTLGEHIRKAEYELLQNLYPFLKLRCCREEDPFCGCRVEKDS